MAGTTFSKWFWSDWLSDPGVRACSYAARGLWMDMLCIMAAADPIGYLVVNGRPLDAAGVARLTGGQLPEVETLLTELDRNGVYSRDRAKRVYSRRLVRDAKRSAECRDNGVKGGNPSLRKQKVISSKDNPPLKPPDKLPDKPHLPLSISQKPVSTQPSEQGALRAQSIALRAAIVRFFEGRNIIPPDTSRVDVWLAQGYQPELILAVVMDHVGKKNIRSLNYFDNAIREAQEARNQNPAAVKKEIDWDYWAQVWARDRAQGEANWPMAMQPNPGDAGCRCPPEVLRRHGIDPATGNIVKEKQSAA